MTHITQPVRNWICGVCCSPEAHALGLQCPRCSEKGWQAVLRQDQEIIQAVSTLTEDESVPCKHLPEPALILSAVAPVPDALALRHQEHLIPVWPVSVMQSTHKSDDTPEDEPLLKCAIHLWLIHPC
jgi:hypothetical protein